MPKTGIREFFVRHWLWLAAAAAIAIWVSFPITRKFAKLDADLLGALGLTLGVWGLILGAAGFFITFIQLDRTQAAASAVQRVVEKLKRHYESFDLITEARTAYAAADETLRHLSGARWPLAATSYHEASRSLYRIAAAQKGTELGLAAQRHNERASAAIAIFEVDNVEISPATLEDARANLRDLVGFLLTLEVHQKGDVDGQ